VTDAVPLDAPHSVVDRIHDAMPRMTAAERQVARALLADLPGGALGTVSQLAAVATVSTATVIRFCRRIGVDGFADLHTLVREEISRAAASPAVRAHRSRPTAALDRDLLHRAELVRSVTATAPAAETERLITMLSEARTVATMGGSLSQIAARYLQLQLRHVRRQVLHLADPMQADVGSLIDLGKRDVVVIFDFRRYESRALRTAEAARSHGAAVALITDVWLSPVAKLADVVIPVDVEATFLDSLTAVIALVESLLPAVAERVGDRAISRMDEVEARRRATE
jgi:DNA-binding MurR/RpiR family transcriptional regulator